MRTRCLVSVCGAVVRRRRERVGVSAYRAIRAARRVCSATAAASGSRRWQSSADIRCSLRTDCSCHSSKTRRCCCRTSSIQVYRQRASYADDRCVSVHSKTLARWTTRKCVVSVGSGEGNTESGGTLRVCRGVAAAGTQQRGKRLRGAGIRLWLYGLVQLSPFRCDAIHRGMR